MRNFCILTRKETRRLNLRHITRGAPGAKRRPGADRRRVVGECPPRMQGRRVQVPRESNLEADANRHSGHTPDDRRATCASWGKARHRRAIDASTSTDHPRHEHDPSPTLRAQAIDHPPSTCFLIFDVALIPSWARPPPSLGHHCIPSTPEARGTGTGGTVLRGIVHNPCMS